MNDTQWQNTGTTAGTGKPLAIEDDGEQVPLNLMGGSGEAAIAAMESAPVKKSNAGALLIAGVLAVAGLTLYAMRATATIEPADKSAAAAEQKIDQVLKRLVNKDKNAPTRQNIDELLRNSDDVVALFAADPVKKQVSVENLQKNPFELFITHPAAAEKPGVDTSDKAKQEAARKYRAELETLKISSILTGTTSLAVVNGKVVRETERLGSFVVTQINKQGLILTADGNTYTLLMPAKSDGQLPPLPASVPVAPAPVK